MIEELNIADPKVWKELKKIYKPHGLDLDQAAEMAFKCAVFGGAIETKEVDGKVVVEYIPPEEWNKRV